MRDDDRQGGSIMKFIACAFAALLAITGAAGGFAADRKTDDSASESPLCKPLPRQRRLVNLTFKPNSLLTDVAGAYSMMACKRLQLTGDLSAHKVTLEEKKRMTLDELSALVRAEAEKAGLRWVEDDTSVALGPVSQRPPRSQ
jgi:hypothetical protein